MLEDRARKECFTKPQDRTAHANYRLTALRVEGDWEGWTAYFLECVREAANGGMAAARGLFTLLNRDRRRLLAHPAATIPAVRLCEALPSRPIVTLLTATRLMHTTKPTAAKAIGTLCNLKTLQEISGRRRDRVYAYQTYLAALTGEEENFGLRNGACFPADHPRVSGTLIHGNLR